MTSHPKLSSTQIALLRRLPLLAGSSDRELAEIARLVDETTVPAGARLTRKGEAAREAFVIVEGWAAVMHDDEPVAALGPGQFVGEMAMLDGGPRTATVVAKTDMRLLVVGPAAFSAFANQPKVARNMATQLAGRLRNSQATAGSA
jgi:CRP-like cAMP-binding protein